MSELSFSRTIITTKILLLLDNFFSFVVSHPLYLFYCIFFSPYLIKILSFLSPLFITTSLLLVSLFVIAFSPPAFVRSDEVVVDENKDCSCFEELEVYKTVFQTTSMHGFSEDKDEKSCVEFVDKIVFRTSSCGFNEEDLVEKSCVTSKGSEVFVDKLASTKTAELIDDYKFCPNGVGVKAFKGDMLVKLRDTEFEKGEDEDEEKLSMRMDAMKYEKMGSKFGSFGSMREEKEWRKTLAYKLFEEERHNVDEGMDSLWETHEVDSNKVLSKRKTKEIIKRNMKLDYNYYDDDDKDEDEDDIVNGDLCCLHALKFSTRKMNLGMRRPSLVKISKALKGINWFHHVGKKGKRVNT